MEPTLSVKVRSMCNLWRIEQPDMDGLAVQLDSRTSVCDSLKQSCERIVFNNFAQLLRRKLVLSHEAVLSLIGQGPAGVGSVLRVPSF
jgi:hypothetical protein